MKQKKNSNHGLEIAPALTKQISTNQTQTIKYLVNDAIADILIHDLKEFHGIEAPLNKLSLLNIALNSAMSDLDLPVGITIRETETGLEVIAERV